MDNKAEGATEQNNPPIEKLSVNEQESEAK